MFKVQDKTGLVADANAYISVDDLKAYFLSRNIPTPYTDEQIQGAIVKSSSFIDTMFEFLGYKIAGDDQTTSFPRYMKTLPDPPEADIPQEVLDATCEYSIYVLSGKSLMVNIAPQDVGIREIEKVIGGAVKKRVEYVGSNTGNNGLAIMPYAEMLLAKSGWLYVRKNVIGRM